MENPLYKHIGEVAPQKERKGGRQGCSCYCSEEGEEEKEDQLFPIADYQEEIPKVRKELKRTKWKKKAEEKA